MITDTMTKHEVMNALRKEFDIEILPYYYKSIFPRLKSAIHQRCLREKKSITLGWETKETSSHNVFKILKRGDNESDKPLFVCEFRWNGKLCYGNFFKEQSVIIYQSHSLQRYAERVLNHNIEIKNVFYEHIVKKQNSAFNIVLPTPTHKFSHYFGLANALFLGDFDERNPKTPFLWVNTCISYNEARYSQSRIMKSLHELQQFVENEGEDLTKIENKNQLNRYIKKYTGNYDKIERLKKFLTQKYLLWKLFLHYNFPFTELFKDEIDLTLNNLEEYMLRLEISPKSLSPFSKTYGIAWKGEIDYQGV